MAADYLGPYRVAAFNTAHDFGEQDPRRRHRPPLRLRRRAGAGGRRYGYMTHLPVVRWGRAWLERGTAECRFLKPVYDGDTANVTADRRRRRARRSRWRAAASCAPPAGRRCRMRQRLPPALDGFRKVPQRADTAAGRRSLIGGGGLARARPLPDHPGNGGALSRQLARKRAIYPSKGWCIRATSCAAAIS